MTDTYLIKRFGQLMPASESDAEYIASLTDGDTYKAVITRPRNIGFHRKYFSLLDVLYEIAPDPEPMPIEQLQRFYGKFWRGSYTPEQLEELQPKKNRDRFRRDMAIVCGYFELVTNSKGETRVEAKSISFANMDQDTFESLYNATLNYGLKHIAKNRTREGIEEWVEQLMSFA